MKKNVLIILILLSLAAAIVYAAKTDPGHAASEIGGTTAADKTFQSGIYNFPGTMNASTVCIAGDCKTAWPSGGTDSDWTVGGTSGTGLYSAVTGSGADADGSFAVAAGKDTNASATAATAIGGYTTASGDYSTAMGSSTTASGTGSTAMNSYTTASGTGSTAMGGSTTASGSYSVAMGNSITVSGEHSVGIGLDITPRTVSEHNRLSIMGGTVRIGNLASCGKVYTDANGVLTCGTDAYNAAYDTEAEIDAAVSNNGYLTSFTETDPQVGTVTTNYGCYGIAGNIVECADSAFYWDKTNNRMGIGTTSPRAPLHIYLGSSGHTYPGVYDRLYLEDDTSAYINILTPSSYAGGIMFSDEEGANRGGVYYVHNSDSLVFLTGGTAALRLGDGSSSLRPISDIICPTGFTSIVGGVSTGYRQLGCMQNDEEGYGSYWDGQDDCFDTYGGKLPTAAEWYIAMANYDFGLDETDNYEHVSDKYGSKNVAIGNGGLTVIGEATSSNSQYYRCWIPN